MWISWATNSFGSAPFLSASAKDVNSSGEREAPDNFDKSKESILCSNNIYFIDHYCTRSCYHFAVAHMNPESLMRLLGGVHRIRCKQ